MADAIGALRVDLSASTAQFEANMKKAKDTAQKSATGMQDAMDKTRKSFDLTSLSITKLAGAMGGIYVVKQLMGIADTYTLLDNKLKLVTKSADELKFVQEGLYQQSLRSFSSYESSVDLYSRFAKATETLGTSQNELLRITETLNKAMIISGASQEESKNAIIQLSQGMASGVLRGEEFNSIMENGSRIAKILADYLNTDVGGLRKMATEGKITSETMIKAFTAATDTIDKEFSKMEPTIDQAMTNLKTVFGRLLSDSNKSAEGTKSVATEIMRLAETIEQNKPGIIELFTEIISLAGKAARAIGNIGQSFQGWAAVKRGDLGIGEFATMGPADLKKWLAGNDTEEKRINNQIARLRQQQSKALSPHYRIPIDREIAQLEAKLKAVQEKEPIAYNYVSPSGGAKISTKTVDERKKDSGKSEAEKLAEAAEKEILQLQREKATIGDVTREEQMLWETTKGRYKDLDEGQKKRIVGLAVEIDSLTQMNEAEKDIIKNWEENEKTIESLKEQADTFGMTEKEAALYALSLKDATEEQMKSASATLDDIEQKKQLKQILEEIKTPYQEYADKIATASALLASGRLSLEDYTLYMDKLNEEIDKLNSDGKDSFEELQQAIEGWGRDSAEAIVDFARKGEMSFSDMIDSMIDDILRMMVYQNITKGLFEGIGTGVSDFMPDFFSSLFGSAKGNVFQGGNVIPFARGGIVDRPTVFPMAMGAGLMGEAGPEAVMPLTRIGGDLGVKAYGGGTEVNIYNNVGADVTAQERATADGGKAIDVYIDQAVAKKLGQFGSQSNKAMRTNYGARTQLTGR